MRGLRLGSTPEEEELKKKKKPVRVLSWFLFVVGPMYTEEEEEEEEDSLSVACYNPLDPLQDTTTQQSVNKAVKWLPIPSDAIVISPGLQSQQSDECLLTLDNGKPSVAQSEQWHLCVIFKVK